MTLRLVASAAVIAASLAAIATPASAQPGRGGGRFDWGGDERVYSLNGPGVSFLLPELRRSRRGAAFVMRNFDFDRNGLVNRREAEAANRAFAEVRGERGEWFAQGPGGAPGGGPGWNREAMRGYGMRQTTRGMTFEMNEQILFAYDSDQLRPGAIDRLRPLADYLRYERGVRVAIDGHTDSRGSDAYNQDLSERRAESVREALEDLGAERARFQVIGHGESDPVASNATQEGMRRNRRVEITLLGRRADEFR